MKKLLFTTLLLLLASPCLAWNWPVITAMQGGGGATCSLLSADFESETDGTDLTAITAAWTDDSAPADAFEIDTTQYYAGAASAKIDAQTSDGNRIYKTITEQTGTFTVSYRLRTNYDSATAAQYLFLSDGGESWPGNYGVIMGVAYGSGAGFFDLVYNNGSTWEAIDTGLSTDTWYLIEITVDLTTDTFAVDVEGVNELSGTAMISTGLAIDRVYLDDKGTSGDNRDIWIDDLCVQ